MTDDENHVGNIVLVTEGSRNYVNPRQLASYREHRRQLAEWMLNLGKTPEKAEGDAGATAKTRRHRLDKFYRWVWENEEDGYTGSILDCARGRADGTPRTPRLRIQLRDLLPESRQIPVQMAKLDAG